MKGSRQRGLVLAVHPVTRGFGWVLFEGLMAPVDWGIATAKVDTNSTSMTKFLKLIQQYQPTAIVLEQFEGGHASRNARIRLLAKAMKGLAENHGIEALLYSRADVGKALTDNPEATRRAVASAVAALLPFLEHRLPDERKPWLPEDTGRCLFDAAALGITHFVMTYRH